MSIHTNQPVGKSGFNSLLVFTLVTLLLQLTAVGDGSFSGVLKLPKRLRKTANGQADQKVKVRQGCKEREFHVILEGGDPRFPATEIRDIPLTTESFKGREVEAISKEAKNTLVRVISDSRYSRVANRIEADPSATVATCQSSSDSINVGTGGNPGQPGGGLFGSGIAPGGGGLGGGGF